MREGVPRLPEKRPAYHSMIGGEAAPLLRRAIIRMYRLRISALSAAVTRLAPVVAPYLGVERDRYLAVAERMVVLAAIVLVARRVLAVVDDPREPSMRQKFVV